MFLPTQTAVHESADPSPAPRDTKVPRGRDQALVAEAITVRFAGVTAVDNVICRVGSGEIVGLIGPNGAGKTTFVNALTGFERLSEGSVTVDGEEVTNLPPEARARKGVFRTFQGSHSFGELTVFENVEVSGLGVGHSRRKARRLATEALAANNLTELAERRAASLTTGQERRLQVARALAARPRYMLLDEPAAGLNEEETDQLIEVIGGLPARLACGVLLIEHDMRVVMSCCGRIVVLDQGKLIKEGTPAEVRSDQRVIDAYLGS